MEYHPISTTNDHRTPLHQTTHPPSLPLPSPKGLQRTHPTTKDSCIRAIVDTTDLKYTFKSSVIEKKIPLEDVIFICGHWNLDRHHRDLNKPFSFLICELALGNIAPFQEDSPLADSLLIEAEPDNDDPYHYDVMLKSYDQYRIKYECTFLVGK